MNSINNVKFLNVVLSIIHFFTQGTTKIVLDPGMITGVCGIIPICQRETRVTTSGFRWDLGESMPNKRD